MREESGKKDAKGSARGGPKGQPSNSQRTHLGTLAGEGMTTLTLPSPLPLMAWMVGLGRTPEKWSHIDLGTSGNCGMWAFPCAFLPCRRLVIFLPRKVYLSYIRFPLAWMGFV